MTQEVFKINGYNYATQYDLIASNGDYVVFHKVWGKRSDDPIVRQVHSIHRKSDNHAFNYMLKNIDSGEITGTAPITDCVKITFTDNPNIKIQPEIC